MQDEEEMDEASAAPFLKIGHVASILGVATSRIRLWEHEGLVVPHRTDGGQRRYAPRDLARLEQVRALLDSKGMTFRGVREAIGAGELPEAAVDEVAQADPVGERAKHQRIAHGMSLRELAGLSGLSPSALSAFERGLSKPNTGRISAIAHALEITVPELLGMPRPADQMVVRAHNRESLPLNDDGVSIELLYKSSTVLQSQSIRVEPDCGIREAITHTGEDFVTVIAGRIDVTLDAIEIHHLSTGDSMTFASHRPHAFHNPGDVPAHLIWVNTPPTF